MPNPQLKKHVPSSLPDDLRLAHEKSMALRGDATFFATFGSHPDLYRWYTDSFYGDVFRGGLVEQRVKELVRLRLSTTHGCRFCNQGNRIDALAAGLTEVDIEQIGRPESDHFDAREMAALRLADQMALTNEKGYLSDTLYDALARHFSDAEILELGLVTGILTGMAKFMFVFDLVEKEDYCPFQA